MPSFGASAAWGLLVAGSLVAGAVVAALFRIPKRLAASISAFGGGILLAAVAVDLVPEAAEHAGRLPTAVGLLTGTIVFVAADAWLTRDNSMEATRRFRHAIAAGRSMTQRPAHSEAARGESIAAGLFVDGVPESLALGFTVAEGSLARALLAGIVIGNVVEAYGAAQPIIAGGHRRSFALGLLAGIGSALAAATIAGGTLLAGAAPPIIGSAQAVAAGAVLAVVSISIIPHAFNEVSRLCAFGAASGFVAGFLLH
ncbi:MAG: hypothetical protein M3198_03000 [Actinomycetota bacterium]|nr:hypothetical protein [Actinomycetota bacterium]